MKYFFLIIQSSILLLFCAGPVGAKPVFDQKQVIVNIKQQTVLQNEKYTIGDIASKVTGGSSQEQEQIRLVSLGESPLPGKTQSLNENYILTQIRRAGYTVVIRMSQGATVMRAAYKIPSSSLKNAIISKIKERYSQYESVDVAIQSKLQPAFVPKGKLSFEVMPPQMQQKLGGAMTWSIALYIDDKQVYTLPVSLIIHVSDEVWVADQVISRKQLITKNNIKEVKKEISSERIGYKSLASDFLNNEARQTIARNSVIRKSILEAPLLIKKGKVLTLEYKSKNLVFSNQVRAMEAGHKNDIIKVKTLNGGRVVFAVVESGDKVHVTI